MIYYRRLGRRIKTRYTRFWVFPRIPRASPWNMYFSNASVTLLLCGRGPLYLSPSLRCHFSGRRSKRATVWNADVSPTRGKHGAVVVLLVRLLLPSKRVTYDIPISKRRPTSPGAVEPDDRFVCRAAAFSGQSSGRANITVSSAPGGVCGGIVFSPRVDDRRTRRNKSLGSRVDHAF